MKLDRSQFPPLTKEDFLCEYYPTAEVLQELLEIMKMRPDLRPGRLRVQGPPKRKRNTK